MTFSADDLDGSNARQIEKRRGFLMVSAVFRQLTEAEREELVGLVMPDLGPSEFGPGECDGSGRCPASRHVHGCFTPHRAAECDAPIEHGHIPEPTDSEADHG